jgi:hypothetical protein
MKESRGVQKLAEEYLVGTIGFIYAALMTVFLIFWSPLQVAGRSRAGSILPSSVALLLYVFPLLYLGNWIGDPTDFIKDIDLAGLNWYEKLILVTILFIVSDCFVRGISWLISQDERRFRKNCERLRYAAAGFVVAFDALLLLLPEYDRAPIFWAFFVVSSYPPFAVLGAVLRSRFRARGKWATLSYLGSFVVTWTTVVATGASVLFCQDLVHN